VFSCAFLRRGIWTSVSVEPSMVAGVLTVPVMAI
jgi:hypothetical protein